jgi:DNA-binding response OmpR family regulator
MPRIFLLEDDKAIARNLVRLLHLEWFSVTHAPTRGDAFARNTFDLALVDISLPDGNGFTVCTEIKENRDVPANLSDRSRDGI